MRNFFSMIPKTNGKDVTHVKRIFALFCAILMLFAAGCTGPTEPEPIDTTAWVTFRTVSGTVVSDDNAVLFEYAYSHPILSTGSTAKVINTKLDNATTAYVYGSGGVEELTKRAKLDSKNSWFTTYSLQRNVSVARADSRVIAFRYSDYFYTGGLVGTTTETVTNYDAVTGQPLSFANLSDDPQGLRAYCRACLLETLSSDAYADAGLRPNYAAQLDTVLDFWALTATGLEFIANPYVLTSTDSAVMRFTIPYEDLDGMLADKWMPEPHSGNGGLSLGLTGSDRDFQLTEEGDRLVIRVSGTVYDFSVEQVTTVTIGERTVRRMGQQYLYAPELTDRSIGITIPAVGSTPDTLIRCRSANGTEHQFYIAKTDKGFELVSPNEPLIRS